MITAQPNIERQRCRPAGIPTSTRHANSKPLPAPPHLGPFLNPRRSAAEVELVDTVIVAVPLVAVALNVTVALLAAQVGSVVAPEGDAVKEQASVTVPEYPPLPVTVTVEVAGEPDGTAAGVVAESVNEPGVTVTATEFPVAGA
jgi:hypothetical protein